VKKKEKGIKKPAETITLTNKYQNQSCFFYIRARDL
jgi:hypothetical protein